MSAGSIAASRKVQEVIFQCVNLKYNSNGDPTSPKIRLSIYITGSYTKKTTNSAITIYRGKSGLTNDGGNFEPDTLAAGGYNGQYIIKGSLNLVSQISSVAIEDFTGYIDFQISDFIKAFPNCTYVSFTHSWMRLNGDISLFTNPNIVFLQLGGYIIGNSPSENLVNLQTLNIFSQSGAGNNTISEIPNTLTLLSNLRIEGNNTISEIPEELTNLTSVTIAGNNTISEIPNTLSLKTFIVGAQTASYTGTSTVSSIPYLPNIGTLQLFRNLGLTVDIANIVVNSIRNLILIDATGSTGSYTYSGASWPTNTMSTVRITARGIGLSSEEVDQLLIDLSQVETWSTGSGGIISIVGTNAPRTPASDTAVATIISRGGNVITN